MVSQQARQVWKAVLGDLQLQVPRPSYETWLKDTVGLAYGDEELVVGAPNAFVAEMLERRMYSLISQAVERVTRSRVDVRFQVALPSGHSDSLRSGLQDGAVHASGEAHHNWNGASAHYPAVADSPPPDPRRSIPLNPKYTFDTFIVGKSNELAHAAAEAASRSPGTVYNPLVMYSDVGLGKTHLLHAIGHRIRSRGLSVIYATTEQFTNEYIKAIREGKTEEFRDRYRSADLLLLDDIQFLIGKEQTQEGFFHTFNALHMSNRQIVVTSDRPVTALTLLEDRVRSRLAGGLVVDIQPPDLETRLAILRAKAELMQADVPAEVVQFIGERIHKNIRELEGNLNRVIAYSQLTHSPVTVELARRALADIFEAGPTRRISEDRVLTAVADHYGIRPDDLKGRKRDKKTALARQVAMYLLREEADMGATAIGRVLGGKDHTTVLHGCKTIENQINVDDRLRREVIKIRQAISEE